MPAGSNTVTAGWLGFLPTWRIIFTRLKVPQHGLSLGFDGMITSLIRLLATSASANPLQNRRSDVYRSLNSSALSYLSTYFTIFTRATDVDYLVDKGSASSGQLHPTIWQYRRSVLLQSANGHFQSLTPIVIRHHLSSQHRHFRSSDCVWILFCFGAYTRTLTFYVYTLHFAVLEIIFLLRQR